uniref:Putative secreted protein n=1 Tax=Rhipicephalus microplus TaxID=6941 RepID=A0A6M2DFD9_RHIMP
MFCFFFFFFCIDMFLFIDHISSSGCCGYSLHRTSRWNLRGHFGALCLIFTLAHLHVTSFVPAAGPVQ